MSAGRLVIGHGLSVGTDELAVRFTRAAGPGGQNVNKVSTAVELRFDLAGSPSLPWAVKHRAAKLGARWLTRDGVFVISADEHRAQAMNRAAAVRRLIELLAEAAVPPRPRIATRPGKAATRRRIEGKTHRATLKAARARPPAD